MPSAVGTFALRDGYVLRLTVEQDSQDVEANTSRVFCYLQVLRPSGQADRTSYTTVWSTSTNGVAANGQTAGYDFGAYSVLWLRSWYQTIPHGPDGTKTITVAGAWRETDPDPQVGYTSAVQASVALELDPIPRATVASWATPGNAVAGTAKTLNLPRASPSFTHCGVDRRQPFGCGWEQSRHVGERHHPAVCARCDAERGRRARHPAHHDVQRVDRRRRDDVGDQRRGARLGRAGLHHDQPRGSRAVGRVADRRVRAEAVEADPRDQRRGRRVRVDDQVVQDRGRRADDPE